MRKILIAIGILILLVVVILLVAPAFINANRYHSLVQAQLEKALGRPVSFGDMHLSLLPPKVGMDKLQIGEDPRFGTSPFVQVSTLFASVKLLPLLRGDVQISAVKLDKPQVDLIRNRQGTWNFASLGKPEQQQAQAPQQQAPPAQPSQPAPAAPQTAQNKPSSGSNVSISDVEITGGQITLVDQQKNSRGVYNNIDLHVTGYAPGQPFDVVAALHLPGPGAELAKLDGRVGPINSANSLQTPFDGSLSLQQVSIGGVAKVANTAAPQVDGVASGTMKLKNENGSVSSSGSVELQQGKVRNVEIGYPVKLDYELSSDLAKDLVNIQKGTLHLGNTPLTITGTANLGPTPAQIDLHVTTSNASLEDAARLASAFGVAFNPGMKVAGNINADVTARGAATSPALNGTLSTGDLTISGSQLKQPVNAKGIQLSLTPSEIRSNQFSASTGNTTVNVQFALANYTSQSPAVDATVKTANANVGELLSMAQAYGASALDGMSGSGTISLDLHASGPIKNTSALNLSGSGKLVNASIKTPALGAPLNVKNADLAFGSNTATLQNLVASLGSTNATGNLTVRNFAAPQLQFTLNADKLNVAEIQGIMNPSAPPAQKRASLSLIPSAWAQAPANTQPSLLAKASGNGNVAINTVQYDQLVLTNLRSPVTLDHGVIKLSPLTAGVYGGQETGDITVDTRTTPMAINVSTKLQQVDANQLVSSVSSVKQTIYGLLAANGNTSFKVGGGPATEIAKTLNGNLAVDLTKGRLAHVDLLYQLASIGKFLGANTLQQQSFTDIVRLTGNFNVANGLAQTNNLRAIIPGGTLAADGSANLASEALNMHVTAVLDKDFSQKVGGSQIGGFMETALANSQGELVIPVLVSGTFSAPHFAPDVQKIAQMKLQHLLPTTGSPGSLTSGLLGAVMGGQKGGQGKSTGGIGGILGSLGGQQPQQQQPASNGVAQPQPANAQTQQPQQPKSALGDIFNQVMNQAQQKKQQTPPPPPH